MPKHKTGLHKNVSSIFSGVPIPKGKDAEQKGSTSTATKEPPTYGPPSHLSKKTMEAPPLLRPSPKVAPAETPKAEEKVEVAPPVVIKKARPEWLEKIQELIKEKFLTPQPGVSPMKQKVMVVLVPVLFIGMVVAILRVLGGGPGKTANPKTFTPSNTVAAAATQINWQIPAPYPTTLRDPMKFGSAKTPDTGDETKTGDIEIKGILYSEENPSAIIGVDIVHEGDKVSGATVVKINPDSVEFEMNGKKWTQKVK
jgi:hypothetical protein